MKLLKMLCLLLVFSVTSCKDNKEALGIIQVVSPTEMQTLLKLDDVQLIDVRTPEELSEGFIVNSQNMDFKSSTFHIDIEKLDKTKPVILYCRSGNRSGKSAKIFKELGFMEIYDLAGGIIRWKDEGLETITK